MSIGGSKSKSKSTGSQSSVQESMDYGSEVWGQQSPFLQDLYNRGQQASFGGLPSQFGQYQGGAMDSAAMSAANLQRSNAGFQQMLNPTVDPAVNAYAQNLGQNFREQFLPELKGQAALAGGLGGSRQQIGSALGAQRAMQTLGDFTAQSYAGQQERALAAAQGLSQNASAYQDLMTSNLQGAEFARSMPWYNLQQYQGLLGAPVQIDKGGWSKGSSMGQQKSKSGSASFNFGFGGG